MPETLYLAISMNISLINHGSKWKKNEYAENKYQTYEYTNNEQDVWSKKKTNQIKHSMIECGNGEWKQNKTEKRRRISYA